MRGMLSVELAFWSSPRGHSSAHPLGVASDDSVAQARNRRIGPIEKILKNKSFCFFLQDTT